MKRFGLLLVTCVFLLSGCTGLGVLNAVTPDRGYEYSEGLVFDTNTKLKLDIYKPKDITNAPVVVFFYGGAWDDGDKSQYKFVGQALSSLGYVAVIPNYRLFPQAYFPDFINDSAQAVKWTSKNIREYGGDPDKVFVMGHSAGAYNAAMLVASNQFMASAGASRDLIRGMIGLAGPYDFLPITEPKLREIFGPPEQFQRTQPILLADGENPPMLLLHGEDDQRVWVKNTRNFARTVSKLGGKVETVIYPEMSHSKIIATLAKPLRGLTDVLNHVDDFIREESGLPPRVPEE